MVSKRVENSVSPSAQPYLVVRLIQELVDMFIANRLKLFPGESQSVGWFRQKTACMVRGIPYQDLRSQVE